MKNKSKIFISFFLFLFLCNFITNVKADNSYIATKDYIYNVAAFDPAIAGTSELFVIEYLPDNYYTTKVNYTWELDIYGVRIQDVTNTWAEILVLINKNISLTTTAKYYNMNTTKFDENIQIFSFRNDSIVQLGNFSDVLQIEVRSYAFDYKADTKFYISLIIHISFIAFRTTDIPLINDLLDVVPLFVILFVFPLILYSKFKKIGFAFGLLFTTIIALLTGMIEIYFGILLILSDLSICYFLLKQQKTEIE